ncbi:YtfJ family protein [Gallaecimonas mangrovi]|uniref:YtfJ family protein n=1 Tax=Gallaecimonas mangrovi TaxID=2291597 RepID=UPI000E2007B0|nr:YtfJ family protein [Gallaecimonas mangrovi]
MRFTITAAALGLALAFPALAHNIKLDAPLPSVTVKDQGAITYQDKKFGFQPFSTNSLTGKVRVIQAFAGRTSAKEINDPLIDAIKKGHLPQDKYQTVTIINVDDAIWGTGAFVRSSAKDAKEEYPYSQIVLDDDGLVRKAWDLKHKSSAIVVLDQQGKVRFVKDGKLGDSDIKEVMGLIQQLLAQ